MKRIQRRAHYELSKSIFAIRETRLPKLPDYLRLYSNSLPPYNGTNKRYKKLRQNGEMCVRV